MRIDAILVGITLSLLIVALPASASVWTVVWWRGEA